MRSGPTAIPARLQRLSQRDLVGKPINIKPKSQQARFQTNFFIVHYPFSHKHFVFESPEKECVTLLRRNVKCLS